ncbi:MAG: hypothetical protein EZS28_010943 [Streblomastix strix]|uniref:Uncharacterized protein n=1 Tax=Streblomastix strix TaxID=222440 RepID=A0A5J4WF11_9EUKA|nr:MAG: hypothetical protein EZS28_010943 [Streblomastix strix]
MDCARDYNVDGSLLGLGEFILLEILCEMEIPQDAQQFLVLCRKTFKLLIHPRYAKIIQSIIEIRPIFIIKEQKQGRSNQNKFIHSDKLDDCTIAIDPVMLEGIVRIEVLFENTDWWDKIIGIADASCSFAAGKEPCGKLVHITQSKGNQKYEDGQRVAVEVDMTIVPRKATFFVDDVEQPNFVIGIPEAVRFWVRLYTKQIFFLLSPSILTQITSNPETSCICCSTGCCCCCCCQDEAPSLLPYITASCVCRAVCLYCEVVTAIFV